MIRHCDGTDVHLSREVTPDYAEAHGSITVSWPPRDPTKVNIACDCGATFDDAECAVIYPHGPLWSDQTLAMIELDDDTLDTIADAVDGNCTHDPGTTARRPDECAVCCARGERRRRRIERGESV